MKEIDEQYTVPSYMEEYVKSAISRALSSIEKSEHSNTTKECKDLKAYLVYMANEHCENHKKALRIWNEGEIDKVWIDTDGYICIEYERGNWWHYNDKGEWW